MSASVHDLECCLSAFFLHSERSFLGDFGKYHPFRTHGCEWTWFTSSFGQPRAVAKLDLHEVSTPACPWRPPGVDWCQSPQGRRPPKCPQLPPAGDGFSTARPKFVTSRAQIWASQAVHRCQSAGFSQIDWFFQVGSRSWWFRSSATMDHHRSSPISTTFNH